MYRFASLFAILLAAALLGAGCGVAEGGGGTDAEQTVVEPTGTLPIGTGPATPGTTPPTAPDGLVDHQIRMQNGQPQGGPRLMDASVGDRVRITVTGDLTEEVHLHGYDVTADLAPGRPAVIELQVDQPGRFEIELEETRTPIGTLQVNP